MIDKLKLKVGLDEDAINTLELIQAQAAEAVMKASIFEKQLKQVERLTNSYSQSMSRTEGGNNSSMHYDNVISMLGDIY